MADIDQILVDQKRLAALMDQIHLVTKTETALQFTAADAEARLGLLEDYWGKFSDNDLVVQRRSDALKDRTYFSKGLFEATVGKYLSAKAWLSERILTTRAAAVPASTLPPQTNIGTTISHQASLEKVKLPRFNGNQRDWEAFKERFQSLVLSDKTMPVVVQFQHLLNCLEGEAAEKLRGTQVIATNFHTA